VLYFYSIYGISLEGWIVRVLFYKRLRPGTGSEYINDLEEDDKSDIVKDIELIEKYGIRAAPVVTRKLQGNKFKGNSGRSRLDRDINSVFSIAWNPANNGTASCMQETKTRWTSRRLVCRLKRMKDVL